MMRIAAGRTQGFRIAMIFLQTVRDSGAKMVSRRQSGFVWRWFNSGIRTRGCLPKPESRAPVPALHRIQRSDSGTAPRQADGNRYRDIRDFSALARLNPLGGQNAGNFHVLTYLRIYIMPL